MQIVHLGKEVLRVTMELVQCTQSGKLVSQMGMRDLYTSPGEPKKATESSGGRVEHSMGKDIKLLVDKRDDGGAVATKYCLEARIVGEPHIDALDQ